MSAYHRPPDPLATAARYTSTATVKERLRIPAANTDFDDRVLGAILAAELGIDEELGRSFPDLGEGVAGGAFRYDAAGVSPPSLGEVRDDGTDTGVFLSKTTLSGTDLEEELEALAEPIDDIDSIPYLWVGQAGAHETLHAITAASDEGTWWDLTTALSSGNWSGFVDGGLCRVILLATTGASAVPAAVTQAATSIAHAIYKAGDAPTGTAGSDALLGALDVSELVRREISRNPLLRGLKATFGVG